MPYKVSYKARSGAKRKHRADGARKKRQPTTTLMKLSKELPFPAVKEYCFLYESPLVQGSNSGLTASVNMLVAPNDLYDFDRTAAGFFRNKQPLYFDQLVSSTGPYRCFFVHHWDIYWTVMNGESNHPLNVIHAGPTVQSSDIDTFTEVMSWPGAQMRSIEPMGGNSKVVIHSKGSARDAAGVADRDKTYEGNFAGSPSNGIFETISIEYPGWTTGTWNYYVGIQARLYATLYSADAVES